ncbi:MAG: hypothetical protein Q9191_005601 [Dirinaria sp. TL-2023a]
MPSPPRPLRRSPPRRPLHDRSEASTNERVSPTLRIIGDPHAPIYASSPFPTHPSHVLPPKSARASGAVPDKVGVSDEHGPTEVYKSPPREQTSSPTANSKSQPDIEETSSGSVAEPWLLSTSEHLSPTHHVTPEADEGYNPTSQTFLADPAEEERPSDEIVQLPSVGDGSNMLDSQSFTPNVTEAYYRQPVAQKASDNSLSSNDSTGTVIRKSSERPARPFYSAFPSPIRPGSSTTNSTTSFSTPVNANLRHNRERASPTPQFSQQSQTSLSEQPSTSHRAVSVSRSEAANVANVQYPIVRPPTASGSWAESTEPLPSQPPPRNPLRFRWKNPLSTVESVGMTDRSSGSQHLPDSSRASKTSTVAANSPSQTPPLPAFPRSTHPPRREVSRSTIRVVREHQDTFDSDLAPIPGSRGSGRFSIFSRNSWGNNRRNELPGSARPSSRGSFFRDSIPAWARTYYGRGARNSMLPQNCSTDNIQNTATTGGFYTTENGQNHSYSTGPYYTDHSTGAYTSEPSASETSLTIQQSRTRPHEHHFGHTRNDSVPITRVRRSEINLVEVRGAPRARVSQTWSPHLWQHRSSVPKRRSLFIAPALDRDVVSKTPKRRNIQVVLFTVGFVFPIGWFVAAVLPLPPRPGTGKMDKGRERPGSRASIAQDLEDRLAPVDEAQYENARWWRNLNRLMMVVGVCIIAAIIALAVIATHTGN